MIPIMKEVFTPSFVDFMAGWGWAWVVCSLMAKIRTGNWPWGRCHD